MNYINYLHIYSAKHYEIPLFRTFLKPKMLLLHTTLVMSFYILFKAKSKDDSKLFNTFTTIFFVVNLIFGFLIIKTHFEHYYEQVFIVYPLVIGKTFFVSFSTHKKESLRFVKTFCILLFLTIFVWAGIILKVRNLYYLGYRVNKNNVTLGSKDYWNFMSKALTQKGFTWQNYLNATENWRCSSPNIKESCEVLGLIKPYIPNNKKTVFFTFGESLFLTPNLIGKINSVYSPDFNFINLSTLNYYTCTGFPYSVIVIGNSTNIKDFAQKSPLITILLKNDWNGKYRKEKTIKKVLSTGKVVYIFEWKLKE